MLYFFFTIVNLQLMTTAETITTCKNDQYTWLFGNQCLEVKYQRMRLSDARKYCNDRGGNLVEIRTLGLQGFITQHLNSTQRGHLEFWIDASDGIQEGWWMWSHKPRKMTYTNWYRGETPMDFGFLFGREARDCAVISTHLNYTWRAVPCAGVGSYNQFSVICQYNFHGGIPSSSQSTTVRLTKTSTTTPKTTFTTIKAMLSTSLLPQTNSVTEPTVSPTDSTVRQTSTTTTAPVKGIVIG